MPAADGGPKRGDLAVEQNPIFSTALRSRHIGTHRHGVAGGAGMRTVGPTGSLRFELGGVRLRQEDLEEAAEADTRLHINGRDNVDDSESPAEGEQYLLAPLPLPSFLEPTSSLPEGASRRRSFRGSMRSQSQLIDISAVNDDVLRSRQASLMVVFGEQSVKEMALTFLTTVYCTAAEAGARFAHVREQIHAFAPRARVYGFAEVEMFSVDCPASTPLTDGAPTPVVAAWKPRDAFSGFIQVVPCYTMKQVSHARVCPYFPWLRHAVVDRPWFFVVMLTWNVLASIFYAVCRPMAASQAALVAGWTIASSQVLLGVVLYLYVSRPIVKLLLSTFDFYLVLFWTVVSTVARINGTSALAHGASFKYADDVAFGAVQLIVLALDAYPPISRRNKGLVWLINAVFLGYNYGSWWYESTLDKEKGGALRIFGTSFPTALLGEASAAALVAFNVRLVFRCWWKKLDLAVVDFPANVVPHLRFEDDDLMLSAAQECDDIALAGSPKFSTSSPSLTNLARSSSHDPDSLRRTTRDDSITREEALQAWMSAHQQNAVTLHVDGSLPLCEGGSEGQVAAVVAKIEASLLPHGFIDTHMVEESCAFSTDRRTFIPELFMLSYSPRPLIAWELGFRTLSKWWFPYVLIVVCGGSAGVLGGYLNHDLSPSSLWLQCVVRAVPIAVVLCLLCFGVSHALARESLKTLDFWYVLVSFGMQNIASSYVYTQSDIPHVAYLHAFLVGMLALFFAFLDCIVVVSFRPWIKGIIGILMALYAINDIFVFKIPDAQDAAYKRHIDLGFTVISAGSLTKLSSLSLMILYLKIAVRTLLLKSSLVYFQFGVVEEIVGVDGFVNIPSTGET